MDTVDLFLSFDEGASYAVLTKEDGSIRVELLSDEDVESIKRACSDG